MSKPSNSIIKSGTIHIIINCITSFLPNVCLVCSEDLQILEAPVLLTSLTQWLTAFVLIQFFLILTLPLLLSQTWKKKRLLSFSLWQPFMQPKIGMFTCPCICSSPCMCTDDISVQMQYCTLLPLKHCAFLRPTTSSICQDQF